MQVEARVVDLKLTEPFVIARGTETEVEVVQVELASNGELGLGEAAPIERYDESAQSALAYVEGNADLVGDDPFALDEIFERLPREQFAARAALDAALHDLCGKLVGLPVWRMLGLRRPGPPTSWTIVLADPDAMARAAEKADDGRFRRLKLKLGGRDGLDDDCHTLDDVAACAERGHGINIKLAKSGGIREAIRMAHAARALGLGVML